MNDKQIIHKIAISYAKLPTLIYTKCNICMNGMCQELACKLID